ncbi:MAG: hypothetical protein ACK49D_09895 [Flavobacteriia bacterium]|jgi:hypothetical protein
MKRILFLTLLVTVFSSTFSSCRKGKADFTLKGVLTDETFNTPHANAQVKLYSVPVATSQMILIGSSTTGPDGSYTFTFPRDKMEKYVLVVTKDNYFEINETIFFSSLSISEDNIRNCGTTAMSWARLIFLNQSPLASDKFRYIKQEGKVDCMECCPATQQEYYGALDTTIYCVNDGNTNYSYYYWVLGTNDQGLKSAFTPAFDTVDIVLNY